MTKIKLCGLSRPCDIEAAAALMPEYVGFVFAEKSRRYVTPGKAAELKRLLPPGIRAVGVFVDARPETIAALLNNGVIDMAQLHGHETEEDVRRLRQLTGRPLIQAFRVETADDLRAAERSTADEILLDSGAGTGTAFDWTLLRDAARPYFLAGGLSPENVAGAVTLLRPYAVDVSSGIETGGVKDRMKMAAFVAAVRKAGGI
ncbi:MAG: phosphoribosylanthranilate isomerase [Lachnospiraceae bacterium]|nr:phosphoribosylanthranilate isomerase [Lachnospiraceae bacterium]